MKILLLGAVVVLGGVCAHLLLRHASLDDGRGISVSSGVDGAPLRAELSTGNHSSARVEIPRPGVTATEVVLEEGRATVQLLDAADLTVSARTSWRCRNSSAKQSDEVVLLTDDGGRFQLTEGVWRIVSSDASSWIEPGPHRITAGDLVVLLVQDVGTLRVRIVDEGSGPIPDVDVQWTPGDARHQPANAIEVTDRRRSVVSDAAGIAEFRSVPRRSGLLAFVKEGWQYESVRLAAIRDEEVMVTLRRTDLDARELTIVEAPTGLPIDELEVWTTSGVVVGRSLPGTNRIVVPGWARSERTLLLRGRGVVPSSFRLAEVPSALLGVYRSVSARILVTSDDPGLVTATVSADLDVGRDDVAIASPDVPSSYVLPIGLESTIELPAGVHTVLSAVADSGLSSERAAFNAADVRLVELSLSNRDAQTVVEVVDVNGAPIRGAIAHVVGFGGRTVDFRSDESGRMRIADGEPNASVTLTARGYVARSFDSISSLGAEERVTLSSASSVRIHVVSRSGTPIAGVELRGDQPWIRSTSGSGKGSAESWASGGALSTVVTDADGRAEILDAAKGALTIEMTLPAAFSSDEFGQSLFSFRRSIVIEGNIEVVDWTVDAPRSVRIAAVDAMTRSRLPSFSLTLADGSSAGSVSGGIWSGWISDSLGDLIVSQPGVGEARVALADLDSTRINEIRLTQRPVFTITCSGLPIELVNAKITIGIFRQSNATLLLVDRSQSQLTNGVGTVEIPSLSGDLQLSVMVQGVLEGFVADPPFIPWIPRGAAVIRFTRRN